MSPTSPETASIRTHCSTSGSPVESIEHRLVVGGAARYSWPAGTGSANTHTNDHSPGKFAGSPDTEAVALGVNLMPNHRGSLFLTLLAAGEAGVRTAVFWRSAMHHNTDALRTNDGTAFCTAHEPHDRLRFYDADGGASLTGHDLTLYGLRA